jgi:hypothetical protein
MIAHRVQFFEYPLGAAYFGYPAAKCFQRAMNQSENPFMLPTHVWFARFAVGMEFGNDGVFHDGRLLVSKPDTQDRIWLPKIYSQYMLVFADFEYWEEIERRTPLGTPLRHIRPMEY